MLLSTPMTSFSNDLPAPTEVLELLEHIETLTCEVHFRTCTPDPRLSERLAEEAARIASDAERQVATCDAENPTQVVRVLEGHRDRLVQALHDLDLLDASEVRRTTGSPDNSLPA